MKASNPLSESQHKLQASQHADFWCLLATEEFLYFNVMSFGGASYEALLHHLQIPSTTISPTSGCLLRNVDFERCDHHPVPLCKLATASPCKIATVNVGDLSMLDYSHLEKRHLPDPIYRKGKHHLSTFKNKAGQTQVRLDSQMVRLGGVL